jgi:GDP/GTP exchange factor required for growth at low temperature
MPHALREMQSFESGLTARAGDTIRRADTPDSILPLNISPDLPFFPSSPSYIIPPDPDLTPLPETSMHSRYSTEVFDVLQTYRGLPQLDRLFSDSAGETTIKMSLRTEDSAAPRNDPRFVLWGEMQIPPDFDGDDVSSGMSSPSTTHSRRDVPRVRIGGDGGTTAKVLIAATIERWIAQLTSELDYDELLNFFLTYRTYISAVDLCHLLICRFHWALSGRDDMVRKIVRVRTFVAIRYWLLTFFVMDFLPNRELRLLLGGWLNTLVKDPILKKHEDGLVSPLLPSLTVVCGVASYERKQNIVRKLLKVAKDCKEAHTRRRRSGSVSTSARQSLNINSPPKPRPTHVLGEKFAEAIAISTKNQDDSDVDLDFDFSPEHKEGPQSIFHGGDSSNAFSFNSGVSVSSPPRPGTGVGAAGAAVLQQPLQINILHQSRASLSAAAAAAAASAAAPSGSGLAATMVDSSTGSPVFPQSALSRVFVKTIGRLGRWKRVLNSRQTVDTGLAVPANVSAFDLELNATGDLLMVRGGVEQYLKMIELPEPEPVTPVTPVGVGGGKKALLDVDGVHGKNQSQAKVDLSQTHLRAVTEEEEEEARESVDSVSTTLIHDKRLSNTFASASAPTGSRRLSISSVLSSASKRLSISSSSAPPSKRQSISSISERASTRTHSTDSFGSIISSRSRMNPFVAQVQARQPWAFDVVSIDDLDLSDTSSEAHPVGSSSNNNDTDNTNNNPPTPPGLRKPSRKLPLRRDFEFVRRSVESVSSMGIRSRVSVASTGSAVSAVSLGGVAGLGNGIHQWQVNALVDSLSDDEDNDDNGGVDEALRRLEGQINPQKRKEKAKKVDGWVRIIQERMAVGDFGDEQPRFFGLDSEDEGEEDDYEIDQHETGVESRGDEQTLVGSTSQVTIGASTEDYFSPVLLEGADGAAVVEVVSAGLGHTSPPRMNDSKPAPEDAVPLEILQSRVPSRPSTSKGSPSAPAQNTFIITPPSKFISSSRRPHRSWVLGVSTDTVVQHFSMIDRELFLGVKPEELILDDWMSCQEVNVLDWAQYLKDRARWKAESRWNQKTSALAAVRGRFNLIVNFVVSEIVLTHPSDRAVLVGKFIRVAFVSFLWCLMVMILRHCDLQKAYVRSNFNTLVAIIAGLRSEWVNKAMGRHWNRVRLWENGVFQKLKQFTSPDDDFKAMRDAIAAMVDSKSLNVTTHTSTVMSNSSTDLPSGKSRGTNDTKTKTPSACIPFIGVYLSQLYRYNRLPDLIDPTSPHDPVGIDAQTVNFESPAHPEVFDSLTPLPPSMQLEPLINVHKQRLIAGVIKDLVAGQHLASRVQYPIDKKLFQKCLRLRGLCGETLQRAYTMYSEPETRQTGYIPL